ncbi:hypothetical protein V6N12_011007 [Hibiscus sabdariffa]|uniref:Uncharacterized protein n=1 Tax=Hibiscus sabdariffa TaxID=183260 RepID=A0ABR2ELS8_9ROSI
MKLGESGDVASEVNMREGEIVAGEVKMRKELDYHQRSEGEGRRLEPSRTTREEAAFEPSGRDDTRKPLRSKTS